MQSAPDPSNKTIRVLAFALYGDQAASTRVRLLQYLPALNAANVQVDVQVLLDNRYLQAMFAGQKTSPWRLLQLYGARLAVLWRARHYDLAWVYMELFPNLPAVFEWCLAKWLCPYVYDCDDAFFHKYDLSTHPLKKLLARKIDRVMSYASEVACGNPYLAAKAIRSGAQKVRVIPSVVDTSQYVPKTLSPMAALDSAIQGNTTASSRRSIRIGWIGSRTTAKYLQALAPLLLQLSKNFHLELVVVGADFAVDGLQVTCLPWRKDREIADIQSFDIGIMPLDDTPWELGKCAFKLIQCMACGIPVVGSRVGANCDVVSHAENGYLASTAAEWTEAFTLLLSDPALRQSIGQAGRRTIQARYSLDSQNQNMVELLLGNARAQSF